MPDLRFGVVFGLVDPVKLVLEPDARNDWEQVGWSSQDPNTYWSSQIRKKVQSLWDEGPKAGNTLLSLIHTILHELLAVKKDRRKLEDFKKANGGQYLCIGVAEPRFEDVVPHEFRAAVARIMWELGCLVFSLHNKLGQSQSQVKVTKDASAYKQWTSLIKALYEVGLLGAAEEKAWAQSVVFLLREWIVKHFGDVQGDEPAAFRLKTAVECDFCPMLWKLCVTTMDDGAVVDLTQGEGQALDLRLSEMALSCLGWMRSRWLCDSVLKDSHDLRLSKGAIADLKTYMSTPDARSEISEAFTRGLSRDVLHSGRSTADILEIYVRIIAILKVVDISGIVLRQVSEPIQDFLRSRDDAVTIILNSFLESSKDDQGNRKRSSETFCVGVAECMEQEEGALYQEYYEGSDLLDPEWTPEPIDAASGHQPTRNLDALSHLVSLSPRDPFIASLQSVLASRLLNTTGSASATGTTANTAGALSFGPEIRLLNIFKQRFTELHLQSSEIMLRDVLESQRLNAEIRGNATTDMMAEVMNTDQCEGGPVVDFHAVVLSRFYWPSLRDEECKWSPAVEDAAAQWAREFGRVKKRRRLEWLRGLGSAKVELELEDRKVVEECTTWQAAVIQAFHSSPSLSSSQKPKFGATLSPTKRSNAPPAVTRTITELVDQTGLDIALVRAACAFWTGKMVLRAVPSSTPSSSTQAQGNNQETYTVLETLPTRATSASTLQATASAAAHSAATSASTAPTTAPKSGADLLRENGALYASFVVGMLTNQGGMKSVRILSMMRMTVPGGFPYEVGEIEEFLGGLVDEGRLERGNGGVWRVKK